MYLYERIFRAIRNWFRPRPVRNFTLEVHTLHSLRRIAWQEDRTPEEVANQFLEEALSGLKFQEEKWQRWQKLTPREQEVTALICLCYTSRQIAARLFISPETVKTHAEHILAKFDASDRKTLRMMLSDWDFSGWDE